MFACTYNTLRKGQAFYIPSGKVKNTNNVEVDYILYRTLYNNSGNYNLFFLVKSNTRFICF